MAEALLVTTYQKLPWETAKTTGIIGEMDFETTQKLTEVYLLQDVISKKTLGQLNKFLFDPGAHDMDKIDPTLIQLHLRLWELTGQENLLEDLFKEILASEALRE
jgi:uncharacterized protein YcbK (DUF882 family)